MILEECSHVNKNVCEGYPVRGFVVALLFIHIV